MTAAGVSETSPSRPSPDIKMHSHTCTRTPRPWLSFSPLVSPPFLSVLLVVVVMLEFSGTENEWRGKHTGKRRRSFIFL